MRFHSSSCVALSGLSSILLFFSCRGDISPAPDGTEYQDAEYIDARDLRPDSGMDGDDSFSDLNDSDAGGDKQLPDQNWDQYDLPFRKKITLQAHMERDRTDLPVIIELTHPGKYILRDICVFEVNDGNQTAPIAAWVWNDPDGHNTQVGFEAPGATPAGQTRQFLVYYRVANSPNPWQWADTTWANRKQLPGRQIGVSGGSYELSREVDENTGRLISGRQTGGNSNLMLICSGWKVSEGFSNSYQLQSNTDIYQSQNAESEPFSEIFYDSDEFQSAFAASWHKQSPVAHTLTLSYRVFRTWSFMQYQLSVDSDHTPLSFSSNDWNARYVYLTNTFDAMVSDTRGDESISKIWDPDMRWLVVYDNASQRGFGWFAPHKGVIRADPDDGPTEVFDSYGYSSGADLHFSALWMAAENKDEIVDLFDAMKPGVQISTSESRDLNIVEPVAGSFYFPDDTLQIVVSTPGNAMPVTASLTMDGTSLPLQMHRVDNSWIWKSSSPLVLTSSDAEGTWTIQVQSGNETRQVSIELRHPVHPHLLFSASDLAQLRARKDGTHSDIWNAMLSEAASYPEPMDDPGPGKDIRSYANRLINLALIQLMDPSQAYEDLLWTYFFKMLRYPNWTSDERPFNNYDLTVGHFLTALALTYDWHYEHLTPDERTELRARLADMTDAFINTGWLRYYPNIDWSHYGTVTNNHYWIRNGGVAAVAYVLQNEIKEARRQAWVDRTEANLSVILNLLEDDGTSNEGVAYHSYGQINLFPWIDMRDRALGGQTAQAIPWFENSILWDLYSITPGGQDNYGGPANFGDCPPYHYNPPHTIQAWLAARLNNGYAQWMAKDIQWPRQTALSYLWYNPNVATTSPDTLPPWSIFSDKGIFVWRSSWNNDAAYFSLKAGSYFGGHEQPDAGHFILHRAGVPYITDYGYSYWKMADEHNLILVDGTGQYGQEHQWMAAVDPDNWASIPFVLGDKAFFDLLADPTPMYQSPDLQKWHREVIGLAPELFLLRDVMEADQEVEFTWLLHSYRTDPPSSENKSYSYKDRRLENPWQTQGSATWLLRPQDAAPALHVKDCSCQNWSAEIEPSFFVPEQNLDVGGYNEERESFELGYRLRRTSRALATSSLVAMWFDDELFVQAIASSEAEGVRLYTTQGDVAVVLWPFAGSASDVSGLSVQGTMGGRRTDQPAFFGRELTQLSINGQVLVRAQTPISLFARTEHLAEIDDPQYVVTQSSSDVVLDVYCPSEPSQLTLDGAFIPFSWSGSILSATVPVGKHRMEIFQ